MQSTVVEHWICGISCASYCTVTLSVRPGIVWLVSAARPDVIFTLADSVPAVAVSVAAPAPGLGTYEVCRPLVVASEPSPFTAQVTVSVLLVSCAVNAVGAETAKVPSVFDGVMVRVGAGFVSLQPMRTGEMTVPTTQTTAKIPQRINASLSERAQNRRAQNKRAQNRRRSSESQHRRTKRTPRMNARVQRPSCLPKDGSPCRWGSEGT